jgi:predicted permease
VIGDALRRRRFAGALPIGERLVLDRRPYTIVGVMPPGFVFPPRGPQFNGQPADAYLPRVFNPFEREARGMFYNHSVIGRLKDGMTREQAMRDTAALASRVTQNYPSELRGIKLEIAASAFVDEVSGTARRPLLMLLGAVFLVLLVACANLANLFLCRAVAREREMGVRTAIGAGRHRLLQLLLAESLLLALAGGALGLAIARVVLDAIPAVLTTRLPGVSGVALDVRVVAFAAVLSVGTALFFGLAPLVAGRRALADVLREGARSVGGRRQGRVQAGLVVASVTLAFVLLVCAGLLGRSFARQMTAESGIHAPNVLSLEVTLPPAAYDEAAPIRSFYRTVVEGVRALPGVRAAAVASDLPLRPDGERRAFTPEVRSPSSAPQPAIAVTWTHGDFFSSFGIPVLRGRGFTADEQAANRGAVIVNQTVANLSWPGEDPIGKRIKWGIPASHTPWLTVVGVVADVVEGPLGSEPPPHAYVPYTDVPDEALAGPTVGLVRRMTVVARSEVDAASLAPSGAPRDRRRRPGARPSADDDDGGGGGEASAPQRLSAAASPGSRAARCCSRDRPLRRAGVRGRAADARDRRADRARRQAWAGARARRRRGNAARGDRPGPGPRERARRRAAARSLLYDTHSYDPLTFTAVPVLLAVVSFCACYLPARRAATVDPVVTLRAE